MTEYMRERNRCFEKLEVMLKSCEEASITFLVYELTKSHLVSDLAIKKRIKLLCEIGKVEINNDIVKWKREQ